VEKFGTEPRARPKMLFHQSVNMNLLQNTSQKLAAVCQEVFLLVERFQGHPEVAKMLSYRLLHRVLHEQCEVKRAAESVPGEITVKPARAQFKNKGRKPGFRPLWRILT